MKFLFMFIDSHIQIEVPFCAHYVKKKKKAFENFSCQNSQNIPSHESTRKQYGLLKEVQQIRLLTFTQIIDPGKER